MAGQSKEIWTIGHSTHSADEFLSMLRSFEINSLVDIRNYPGSRRFPHFNSDALKIFLEEHQIKYHHLKSLGGRRKPVQGSVNTSWRHPAFRGYADYMATTDFTNGVSELIEISKHGRTAYMCSEAVWWSCHRALLSDYLKVRGWTVYHIMAENKITEHPYTSAARIVNGSLRYDQPELFNE